MNAPQASGQLTASEALSLQLVGILHTGHKEFFQKPRQRRQQVNAMIFF
jgi:hypothetical protein